MQNSSENLERLGKLQVSLQRHNIDACIILKPQNLRYYTGFHCAIDVVERLMGLVLPADIDGRLILPPLEVTLGETGSIIDDVRACHEQQPILTVIEAIREMTPEARRVGVEFSYATLDKVEAIKAALPTIELVDITPMIMRQRQIKSPLEIEHLRRAAQLADIGMQTARANIKPGVTELAVAGAIIEAMMRSGSEGIPFIPTVQGGERALLPNSWSSNRVLQPGEYVVVDLGARYHGLCSDICRTFYTSGEPTEPQRQIYEVVEEAQRASLATVRGGALAADPDGAARRIIEEAGYGEYIMHRVGHAVGYDVHEAPMLGRHPDERLEPGMVLTLEPGIYQPGVGGVRIEDMIVVTEDGYVPLTS